MKWVLGISDPKSTITPFSAFSDDCWASKQRSSYSISCVCLPNPALVRLLFALWSHIFHGSSLINDTSFCRLSIHEPLGIPVLFYFFRGLHKYVYGGRNIDKCSIQLLRQSTTIIYVSFQYQEIIIAVWPFLSSASGPTKDDSVGVYGLYNSAN